MAASNGWRISVPPSARKDWIKRPASVRVESVTNCGESKSG